MTQSPRPPNLTPQDACRKAFEEWLADYVSEKLPRKNNSDGSFTIDLSNPLYEAWQAAYNRPKAEVDEIAYRMETSKRPHVTKDYCVERYDVTFTPADDRALVEKVDELFTEAVTTIERARPGEVFPALWWASVFANKIRPHLIQSHTAAQNEKLREVRSFLEDASRAARRNFSGNDTHRLDHCRAKLNEALATIEQLIKGE